MGFTKFVLFSTKKKGMCRVCLWACSCFCFGLLTCLPWLWLAYLSFGLLTCLRYFSLCLTSLPWIPRPLFIFLTVSLFVSVFVFSLRS
ncbi:hypothetical protein BDV97DRAFT_363885 [Delphinella strobiligena]|nr:hypothetical protein BDV97DRAFT_363885 [Delphinella strobiligena]